MRDRKIYKLTLVEPYEGETEYYFTTREAIYERLPFELIGVACPSLRKAMKENDGWYANRRCTIRRFPLYGKAHTVSHDPIKGRIHGKD